MALGYIAIINGIFGAASALISAGILFLSTIACTNNAFLHKKSHSSFNMALGYIAIINGIFGAASALISAGILFLSTIACTNNAPSASPSVTSTS